MLQRDAAGTNSRQKIKIRGEISPRFVAT